MSTDLKAKPKSKTQKPKQYAVILINDDFTPMDLVVTILERVFQKSNEEAEKITIDIHKKGQGVCGIYTLEIAETKILQVEHIAKKAEVPLKAELADA
jgi:ATP-dependent Clp protease adaptor protein ClpS